MGIVTAHKLYGDGSNITGVGGTVAISMTAPSSADVGDLWWDSDDGDLLVYFNDGSGSQWVSTNSGATGAQGASGSAGSAGAQGAVGAQGAAGSATSTNVIAPFAYARVFSNSSGSGTNISWTAYDSSTGFVDFTFSTAQGNTNYTGQRVVGPSEYIVPDIGIKAKVLDIDEIINNVTNFYNVTKADLKSKTRKHNIVKARQIVMYLAKELTSDSLDSIGKKTANRGHATVIYSINSTINYIYRHRVNLNIYYSDKKDLVNINKYLVVNKTYYSPRSLTQSYYLGVSTVFTNRLETFTSINYNYYDYGLGMWIDSHNAGLAAGTIGSPGSSGGSRAGAGGQGGAGGNGGALETKGDDGAQGGTGGTGAGQYGGCGVGCDGNRSGDVGAGGNGGGPAGVRVTTSHSGNVSLF